MTILEVSSVRFKPRSNPQVCNSSGSRVKVPVTSVADEADHDWVRIFTQMGVLPHAIQIGTLVRIIAWLGMLGTVAWFCWQFFRQEKENRPDLDKPNNPMTLTIYLPVSYITMMGAPSLPCLDGLKTPGR